MTGTVDVQILNRLLEHRNFPKLIDLIRIYFQDTAAKGIMARIQLIEMVTASLSDLMKEYPEHPDREFLTYATETKSNKKNLQRKLAFPLPS